MIILRRPAQMRQGLNGSKDIAGGRLLFIIRRTGRRDRPVILTSEAGARRVTCRELAAEFVRQVASLR